MAIQRLTESGRLIGGRWLALFSCRGACRWGGAVLLGLLAISASAGGLNPPAPPDSPASALPTLQDLHDRLTTGTNAPLRLHGFREPSVPPSEAPNGVTLDDIMAVAPVSVTNAASVGDVREGRIFWALSEGGWGVSTGSLQEKILSPAPILEAGYYPETEYAAVEPELLPVNLRAGVVLFGVTGATFFASDYPAPVARTGASVSMVPGDDGERRSGVGWPTPRFEVLSGDAANCVVDRLTGLMWLREPLGMRTYVDALADCNNLDGQDGRGGYTDWRLPNVRELMSLIDYGSSAPLLLPSGHPFAIDPDDPSIELVWSSTRVITDTRSLVFSLRNGRMVWSDNVGSVTQIAWPVRGPVEVP